MSNVAERKNVIPVVPCRRSIIASTTNSTYVIYQSHDVPRCWLGFPIKWIGRNNEDLNGKGFIGSDVGQVLLTIFSFRISNDTLKIEMNQPRLKLELTIFCQPKLILSSADSLRHPLLSTLKSKLREG